MISSRFLQVTCFALAAAFAPMITGCFVPPEPAVVEGYEPAYYEGNLVYYDDYGVPYYYDGGARIYVPRTYAHYGVLVGHYRTYRGGYHHWYVHGGYRSKGYHQAAPRVHSRPGPGRHR